MSSIKWNGIGIALDIYKTLQDPLIKAPLCLDPVQQNNT